MKVGSLVECINERDVNSICTDLVKNKPIKGKPYTIRDIFRDSNSKEQYLVRLEEIVVGFNTSGVEFGIPIEDFRELIIPPAIEAEIEEILEGELVLK